MQPIDISGQRFGRVIALERDYSLKGRTYWRCICDCGNMFSTVSYTLRVGECKSCGCSQKEGARERRTSHGMAGTKVYTTWQRMQARCYNETNKAFKDYGGRGIKVCDRWLESFENFLEDMGYPQPHESIDRRDNDGDYCPENCRWADNKTQARNKRNNHFIVLDGDSKTIAEWGEITGIDENTISERLKSGWSDRDALTKPVSNSYLRNPCQIKFNGESKTISEWSKVTSISRDTIRGRLRRGWSIERTLTIPDMDNGIGKAKRT